MPFRADMIERRWAFALLLLLCAVPLLWPHTPPLVDLPGHMGRYRVQLDMDHVPSLARAYGFQWRLIGNLGIDLLIIPFAKLFGLELGVKLIVLAIPPITAAGMLWLGREVHGRVPAAALFALPLIYGFPFHFGFTNFVLSVGLAFNLLALWVRLGRTGRLRLRAALFLPLGFLLWVMHTVGWGLLGICAFGTELVRLRRERVPFVRAVVFAGLACLPLALPLLPMILLRSHSRAAGTWDWFNWYAKLNWLISILRDRWKMFDVLSAAVLGILLVWSAVERRLRVDPMLSVPALLCFAAFILMPRIVTGSAYADMRLLPFTCALAVLAIDVRPGYPRLARTVVAAGLAFFLVRIAGTTASFLLYDAAYKSELQALDHVPEGAPVLSLVDRNCRWSWSTERFEHLPSMAIVRRDSFTNDQWSVDSAQLITIREPGVGRYAKDPSQMIFPRSCRGGEGSDLEGAIASFNRNAFDYVWTISSPPGAIHAPDLKLVWSNGHSALYRVVREGRG